MGPGTNGIHGAPMAVTSYGSRRVRLVADSRRQPLVANSVMGMLLFVIIEAMLFAGMISAFTIIRSGAMIWPPPDQPRLPIERTAINTAALLASDDLMKRTGTIQWVEDLAEEFNVLDENGTRPTEGYARRSEGPS